MKSYRREQGLDGGSSHHGSSSPPEIKVGDNGRAEVKFGSHGCKVVYDPDGSRLKASDKCTKQQKKEADRAMASYRREQGMGSGYAD